MSTSWNEVRTEIQLYYKICNLITAYLPCYHSVSLWWVLKL